ncbi:MAG: hypothetical protein HY711_04705 [Candidatus Melainabacteria bacterium]|nr:hypothetical protein [Candidatus Melainabacteria bacterium]
MNFELQRLVESKLKPGEKLLWSGSPDPKCIMKQSLPVVMLIALASIASLTVCFLLYVFKVLAPEDLALNATIFYLLVGSLILGDALCCFVLLRSRYIGAQRTLYVVTSDRVLIVKCDKSNDIVSLAYENVKDVQVFGEKARKASVAITSDDTYYPRISLVGISDASTVEGLIRRYSSGKLGN